MNSKSNKLHLNDGENVNHSCVANIYIERTYDRLIFFSFYSLSLILLRTECLSFYFRIFLLIYSARSTILAENGQSVLPPLRRFICLAFRWTSSIGKKKTPLFSVFLILLLPSSFLFYIIPFFFISVFGPVFDQFTFKKRALWAHKKT